MDESDAPARELDDLLKRVKRIHSKALVEHRRDLDAAYKRGKESGRAEAYAAVGAAVGIKTAVPRPSRAPRLSKLDDDIDASGPIARTAPKKRKGPDFRDDPVRKLTWLNALRKSKGLSQLERLPDELVPKKAARA